MSEQDLQARIAQLEAQHAAVAAERDQLRARVAELAPTWRLLHVVEVEVATVSEANQSGFESPFAKNRRHQLQKEATSAALWSKIGRLEGPRLLAREGKLLVCMTRLGAKLLDDDNLAGALKHIRDATARWLGTDDNPRASVRWYPAQEAHKRWRLRPRVRLELLGPESEAGGQMVLR